MQDLNKLRIEDAVIKLLGLEHQVITKLTLELSVESPPKVTVTQYIENSIYPNQLETLEYELVQKGKNDQR